MAAAWTAAIPYRQRHKHSHVAKCASGPGSPSPSYGAARQIAHATSVAALSARSQGVMGSGKDCGSGVGGGTSMPLLVSKVSFPQPLSLDGGDEDGGPAGLLDESVESTSSRRWIWEVEDGNDVPRGMEFYEIGPTASSVGRSSSGRTDPRYISALLLDPKNSLTRLERILDQVGHPHIDLKKCELDQLNALTLELPPQNAPFLNARHISIALSILPKVAERRQSRPSPGLNQGLGVQQTTPEWSR